ncbi:MAG TPA: serine--tRNA ligase [Candidatus Dormibacteraeota bacterium]|nr:serine--tRNA ligase [Candidatus Dormibacteraeota bacterium]
MLDIRFVRDNPDAVKDNLKRRGEEEKVAWVDELLANDVKWRNIQSEANNLRNKRNKITEQIAQLRKKREDASSLIREAEQIPEQIRGLEKQTEELEGKITATLMQLPNIMHDSVPFGKDENDNQEIKKWGALPDFHFQPKDHIDLADNLGLIDIERAAKVAGARFYYLRGDLVKLNYALIHFALDFLEMKGFNLCQPPYLLRRDAVGGAIALSDFEDVLYKVEGEDLYLLATSEHAMLAQHMGEILDGKLLPLKYGGVSPCFRKEAGAHGRDTKGIFRIHQFEKVEQFVFCKPEQSWEEHEKLIANAEELVQTLKIPYRVVNVCTGDLGSVAAKKYDLEAWMPGQGKYREIVSCSNCTTYQAVRSKIRFRDKPDEPTKWVHTLNSTLVATERTLVAIMENYQAEDGSINVPEILQTYMQGAKKIKPAVSP